MNRALAFSIAALPFAAAFGLYATGTLEVVRRKGKDVLWSVSLRPGDNADALLILDDRRARDPQKNPHDNQSSFTALRRVK